MEFGKEKVKYPYVREHSGTSLVRVTVVVLPVSWRLSHKGLSGGSRKMTCIRDMNRDTILDFFFFYPY